MPTRKKVKELETKYLERASVQINTRVPLLLRIQLDEYLIFMEQLESRRPNPSHDWPKSISGVLNQALEEFIDAHPLKERAGPEKKADYQKIRKTSKIVARASLVDNEDADFDD